MVIPVTISDRLCLLGEEAARTGVFLLYLTKYNANSQLSGVLACRRVIHVGIPKDPVLRKPLLTVDNISIYGFAMNIYYRYKHEIVMYNVLKVEVIRYILLSVA